MAQATREGILQKRTHGFVSTWQPRYFRIDNATLCYWKTHADSSKLPPQGLIDIPNSEIAINAKYPYAFIVGTKARVYLFQAANDADRASWISALLAVKARANEAGGLSLYTTDLRDALASGGHGLHVTLSGNKLPKMDAGLATADPFFTVSLLHQAPTPPTVVGAGGGCVRSDDDNYMAIMAARIKALGVGAMDSEAASCPPLYRSEVIKQNLNPTWKPFSLSRDFLPHAGGTVLRIDVYDWDKNGVEFIGKVQCEAGDLACVGKSLPLTSKSGTTYHNSSLRVMTSAILHTPCLPMHVPSTVLAGGHGTPATSGTGAPIASEAGGWRLVIRGKKLARKDWSGSSDPVLELLNVKTIETVEGRDHADLFRPDEAFISLYKSEIIPQNLNPHWLPFYLLDDDANAAQGEAFVLRVWDWDNDGGRQLIGATRTLNLFSIVHSGFPIPIALSPGGKYTGHVVVDSVDRVPPSQLPPLYVALNTVRSLSGRPELWPVSVMRLCITGHRLSHPLHKTRSSCRPFFVVRCAQPTTPEGVPKQCPLRLVYRSEAAESTGATGSTVLWREWQCALVAGGYSLGWVGESIMKYGLIIEVYHLSANGKGGHSLLGSIGVSPRDLRHPQSSWGLSHNGVNSGFIHIAVEFGSSGSTTPPSMDIGTIQAVELNISGCRLQAKDLTSSDPFLEVRCASDKGRHQPPTILYRSETVKRNLNPQFSPFVINMEPALVEKHGYGALVIDVYDRDKDGTHDLIGSVRTSMFELASGPPPPIILPLSASQCHVGDEVVARDAHAKPHYPQDRSQVGKLVISSVTPCPRKEKAAAPPAFSIKLAASKMKRQDGIFGKADPFFEIVSLAQRDHRTNSYGTVVYRSEVVHKSLNPEWEPFALLPSEVGGMDQKFLVTVYDHDADGTHDKVGVAEATLSSWTQGMCTAALASSRGAEDSNGALQVVAIDALSDVPREHADQTRASHIIPQGLTLSLQCRKLKRADGPLGKADPFITIKVANKIVARTPVMHKNLAPQWQPHTFDTSGLRSVDDVVEISLYDWDADGSHDLYGTVKVTWRELSLKWFETSVNGKGCLIITDVKPVSVKPAHVSEALRITTSMAKLPHLDGMTKKVDPFFEVTAGSVVLYRSEVIKQTMSPTFQPFTLDVAACAGLDAAVKISSFDWDLDGDHDLIGELTITLREWALGPFQYGMKKRGSSRGCFSVDEIASVDAKHAVETIPEGLLFNLRLHRLARADGPMGQSDPYVEVGPASGYSSGDKFPSSRDSTVPFLRTSYQRKTLAASWDEVAVSTSWFTDGHGKSSGSAWPSSMLNGRITFHVKDFDKDGTHDSMGSITLTLREMLMQNCYYKITKDGNHRGSSKSKGGIEIVNVVKLEVPPVNPLADLPWGYQIAVSCNKLPRMDARATASSDAADPFFEVVLGASGKTGKGGRDRSVTFDLAKGGRLYYRSEIVPRNQAPTFQPFVLSCADLRADPYRPMQLDVWDADHDGEHDKIGTTTVCLAQLLVGPWFSTSLSGKHGAISLSIVAPLNTPCRPFSVLDSDVGEGASVLLTLGWTRLKVEDDSITFLEIRNHSNVLLHRTSLGLKPGREGQWTPFDLYVRDMGGATGSIHVTCFTWSSDGKHYEVGSAKIPVQSLLLAPFTHGLQRKGKKAGGMVVHSVAETPSQMLDQHRAFAAPAWIIGATHRSLQGSSGLDADVEDTKLIGGKMFIEFVRCSDSRLIYRSTSISDNMPQRLGPLRGALDVGSEGVDQRLRACLKSVTSHGHVNVIGTFDLSLRELCFGQYTVPMGSSGDKICHAVTFEATPQWTIEPSLWDDVETFSSVNCDITVSGVGTDLLPLGNAVHANAVQVEATVAGRIVGRSLITHLDKSPHGSGLARVLLSTAAMRQAYSQPHSDPAVLIAETHEPGAVATAPSTPLSVLDIPIHLRCSVVDAHSNVGIELDTFSTTLRQGIYEDAMLLPINAKNLQPEPAVTQIGSVAMAVTPGEGGSAMPPQLPPTPPPRLALCASVRLQPSSVFWRGDTKKYAQSGYATEANPMHVHVRIEVAIGASVIFRGACRPLLPPIDAPPGTLEQDFGGASCELDLTRGLASWARRGDPMTVTACVVDALGCTVYSCSVVTSVYGLLNYPVAYAPAVALNTGSHDAQANAGIGWNALSLAVTAGQATGSSPLVPLPAALPAASAFALRCNLIASSWQSFDGRLPSYHAIKEKDDKAPLPSWSVELELRRGRGTSGALLMVAPCQSNESPRATSSGEIVMAERIVNHAGHCGLVVTEDQLTYPTATLHESLTLVAVMREAGSLRSSVLGYLSCTLAELMMPPVAGDPRPFHLRMRNNNIGVRIVVAEAAPLPPFAPAYAMALRVHAGGDDVPSMSGTQKEFIIEVHDEKSRSLLNRSEQANSVDIKFNSSPATRLQLLLPHRKGKHAQAASVPVEWVKLLQGGLCPVLEAGSTIIVASKVEPMPSKHCIPFFEPAAIVVDVSASDIRKLDKGGLGKSDPFVEVYAGSKILWRTPFVKDATAAKFGDVLIDVADVGGLDSHITFKLQDFDRNGEHDLIGTSDVTLREILMAAHVHRLVPSSQSSKSNGGLRLARGRPQEVRETYIPRQSLGLPPTAPPALQVKLDVFGIGRVATAPVPSQIFASFSLNSHSAPPIARTPIASLLSTSRTQAGVEPVQFILDDATLPLIAPDISLDTVVYISVFSYRKSGRHKSMGTASASIRSLLLGMGTLDSRSRHALDTGNGAIDVNAVPFHTAPLAPWRLRINIRRDKGDKGSTASLGAGAGAGAGAGEGVTSEAGTEEGGELAVEEDREDSDVCTLFCILKGTIVSRSSSHKVCVAYETKAATVSKFDGSITVNHQVLTALGIVTPQRQILDNGATNGSVCMWQEVCLELSIEPVSVNGGGNGGSTGKDAALSASIDITDLLCGPATIPCTKGDDNKKSDTGIMVDIDFANLPPMVEVRPATGYNMLWQLCTLDCGSAGAGGAALGGGGGGGGGFIPLSATVVPQPSVPYLTVSNYSRELLRAFPTDTSHTSYQLTVPFAAVGGDMSSQLQFQVIEQGPSGSTLDVTALAADFTVSEVACAIPGSVWPLRRDERSKAGNDGMFMKLVSITPYNMIDDGYELDLYVRSLQLGSSSEGWEARLRMTLLGEVEIGVSEWQSAAELQVPMMIGLDRTDGAFDKPVNVIVEGRRRDAGTTVRIGVAATTLRSLIFLQADCAVIDSVKAGSLTNYTDSGTLIVKSSKPIQSEYRVGMQQPRHCTVLQQWL